MPNILDEIVARKRIEIEQARAVRPLAEIQRLAEEVEPSRDFLGALRRADGIALIAEVKKASPSQGLIREDFDPTTIARIYATHGASCISVLTDESFFRGSLNDLKAVRQAVDVPLLRKDFVLDAYQIYEARAAGADAVLLIAECLSPSQLREFSDLARELGMVALIELYDPENLAGVLASGTPLVGVNNRDLRTFKVDLWHSIRMRSQVPSEVVLVGESGINSRADVTLLESHHVDAMLVGESLMRQQDIGAGVDALLGQRT